MIKADFIFYRAWSFNASHTTRDSWAFSWAFAGYVKFRLYFGNVSPCHPLHRTLSNVMIHCLSCLGDLLCVSLFFLFIPSFPRFSLLTSSLIRPHISLILPYPFPSLPNHKASLHPRNLPLSLPNPKIRYTKSNSLPSLLLASEPIFSRYSFQISCNKPFSFHHDHQASHGHTSYPSLVSYASD